MPFDELDLFEKITIFEFFLLNKKQLNKSILQENELRQSTSLHPTFCRHLPG